MSLSLRALIYGDDESNTQSNNNNNGNNKRQQRTIEDDETSSDDDEANNVAQVQRLDLQQDDESSDMDEESENGEEIVLDKSVTSNTQSPLNSNNSNRLPTAARLDALYSSLSRNEPIQPDRVHSTVWYEAPLPSRQEHPEKRHYCRPGRPPFKDPQAALELLETQPQALVRKQKRNLNMEWTTIRRKWKRRKFDFQHETDIGNAIAQTIRDALREQQARTSGSQQAAAAPQPPQQQIKEQVPGNDEDDDQSEKSDAETSDEEQNAILDRMMQASRTEQQQADESSSRTETDLRPYAERLDYWERGFQMPPADQLPVNYVQRHQQLILPKQKPKGYKRGKLKPTDETTVTMGTFVRPRDLWYRLPPPQYLPLQNQSVAMGWFTHGMQIFRMAARYTLGVAGTLENGETENRLLKALWNKNFTDCHRLNILLMNASQQAQNLQFFLQHEWKNRAIVAQQLGIAQDQQLVGPLHLVGTALERIKVMDMYREDRDRVKTKWGLMGTIEWTPESNYNAEGSRSSSQGVVMNQTPTTSYIHVPGSIPPVPCFPLDETGILFGPVDKFAHVRHKAPVPEQVYKLTLSSLLSRVATAHLEGESDNEKAFDELLVSMMKQAIELNENRFFKIIRRRRKAASELPLASFYKVLMDYCSLMVNGYPQPLKLPSAKKEDIENDILGIQEGSDDDEEDDQQASLDIIASRLFDFGEQYIEHNGLQLFAPLHLTFGLLRVAKMLPESAVKVLSRAFDDRQCRTPFDIIHQLLVHLEENGMLVDIATSSTSKVNVGALEYALYQAAECFGRCIARDPADVNYHAWHIAALSGCLLLCSGNRIGSAAHPYPSYFISDDRRLSQMFDGPDEDDVTHEVRRMLPKFHELRKETLKAFKLLAHLVKYQQGPRSHLAVSSFLEWRQALALIVGAPAQTGKDPYREIRSMHGWHAREWALKENSSLSMKYLQSKESVRDERLEQFATLLESDPGNLQHWRALVKELGPIGIVASAECQTECSECQECSRLRDGLNVDHNAKGRHRSTGWAKDRQEWWASHLLNAPTSTVTILGDENTVRSSVEALLEEAPVEGVDESGEPTPATNDGAKEATWLDAIVSTLDSDDNEDEVPSTDDRSQTVDALLPQTFLEVLDESFVSEPLDAPLPVSASMEVRCYRILIICHLNGMLHPGVERSVIALVNECWDYAGKRLREHWEYAGKKLREESPAWTVLRFLHKMGLNIPKVLRDHSQPVGIQRKKKVYPQEIKDAVREGFDIFGSGWLKIRRHFSEVFQGWQEHTAKHCYERMVADGEIDPEYKGKVRPLPRFKRRHKYYELVEVQYTEDGCYVPKSKPPKAKDGTFLQQKVGRCPKGFVEWDKYRGVWLPEGRPAPTEPPPGWTADQTAIEHVAAAAARNSYLTTTESTQQPSTGANGSSSTDRAVI